jgi:hypothetical protein
MACADHCVKCHSRTVRRCFQRCVGRCFKSSEDAGLAGGIHGVCGWFNRQSSGLCVWGCLRVVVGGGGATCTVCVVGGIWWTGLLLLSDVGQSRVSEAGTVLLYISIARGRRWEAWNALVQSR